MAGIIRQTAFIAAVLAVVAVPVRAQDQPKAPPKESLTEEAEKAFRQSIEAIIRALEKFVSSVPLYEAPEVLENGDIIIRRKQPDKKPPQRKDDKSPDTSRT